MAEIDRGIDIWLFAIFLAVVYPPVCLDCLQQQPWRQSDEADVGCRMLFLKDVNDVVHSKKLIAS